MDKYGEIDAELEALAAARGLDLFGVARLGPEAEFGRYVRWLDKGMHAGMSYLGEHLALREDPSKLLMGSRTALIVGLAYYQGDKLERAGVPRIAQYARLKDYHKVLWRRGEGLLEDVLKAYGERFGGGAARPGTGRVVVDSAPILERALAARAGGGFIGKNTCFIHPEKGSFFLLAEILTTLALPAVEAEPVAPDKRTAAGGCGTCKRCQVNCPTGALDEAYQLDANKCLAYWTIEHRGTIPEQYWPWLKHYVFGCDICQLVCPYNRGASIAADDELVKLKETPPLREIASMTQDQYERMFGGTPMTRAKRGGLMRNALIAMTVTNDPGLPDVISELNARDDVDAVVRETMIQVLRFAQDVN